MAGCRLVSSNLLNLWNWVFIQQLEEVGENLALMLINESMDVLRPSAHSEAHKVY